MFEVHMEGWYWTPSNELRACLVLESWGGLIVLDAESLERVEIDPRDVMIEKPEG